MHSEEVELIMSEEFLPYVRAGLVVQDSVAVVVLVDGDQKIVAELAGLQADVFRACLDGSTSVQDLALALSVSVEQVKSVLAELASLHILADTVLPKRQASVFVQQIADEAIVYDHRLTLSHSLNGPASQIFELCDGETSVDEAASKVYPDAPLAQARELIYEAVSGFNERHLVDTDSSYSAPDTTGRRKFLKTLTAAAAIPLISSAFAPHPAAACSACQTGCNQTDPNNTTGPVACCSASGGSDAQCAVNRCYLVVFKQGAVGSNTCLADRAATGGGTVICVDPAVPVVTTFNTNCATASTNAPNNTGANYGCLFNCT